MVNFNSKLQLVAPNQKLWKIAIGTWNEQEVTLEIFGSNIIILNHKKMEVAMGRGKSHS
jgi:hypothetical protein